MKGRIPYQDVLHTIPITHIKDHLNLANPFIFNIHVQLVLFPHH